MFPKQSNNSFANTVNIYAGMPEPSEQESEAVRSLKAMIADVKELESMRRTLARFFSLSLKKAFLLSNNGLLESQTLIERQCSNLIPLLDLWSMASRGQFFTRVVGEYQDLDECLRLLHSLLLFESCTTSKIAITEEFPNLLYVDAEKLSIEAMEELSLRERNNPLCLRVQSTLESPILRHDWSLVGSDPHAVIDLQQMCSADQFECSIFPSPLNAEQKDSEKKTGVKHQRTTRFNLKRVMRSKDCNMAIIHIFRQSMDFINNRLVYTVKRNRVVFPQNEMLTIDGVCMRIHSLVLWSNSHYMSLVFCERTRRWWHINDMLTAGRRFQDFGPTLADAINFVNNFGMIVTTVACIPTQPRSAARELEQQCFVELPKFCLASDSMHLKAILIHKDQHRLLSARSVLSLISQPTFVLPNRFLFGPDDPNHDFIFRPDWFNGEPLVSQQSGIVLAIASGFSPSIQHVLDVPLDHVVSLEKRISTMTSITIEATMQKIQARAANNIETIRCLQTGQRLNAKQFSNFTQAINARLVDCDAKQFIDSGSEKNAWYTLNAKSWIIDPVVMTVLMSDTMPLHARNTLGANYLRRSEDYAVGPYFNLEKIVLPFYVQDRGFVVLVEPAKRQISFFDPFRKIDETSSVWIALFLVHLQRTFFKQPTACKEDWAVTHVLVDQSLANFELDLILLHICHEIVLGSESQLFSVFESKETTLDTLVQLFRRVGDMKK